MTNPQKDADGWIPWSGCLCPVKSSQYVDVKRSGGQIHLNILAGWMSWGRPVADELCIVAYRVIE